MNILFGEEGLKYLSSLSVRYDKIFIITDNNVKRLHGNYLKTFLQNNMFFINIKSTNESKNIETVLFIWEKLMEKNADKNSLVINFGGGTISDIGAFAASCYKRGLDFINIPTTLLAMIDASIGGKNGINFNNFKNQIGLFTEPQDIIICERFLDTLDKRDILSGMAEMMKYAFVADPAFLDIDKETYSGFICKAAELKDDIVKTDFNEKGYRKILNFGHTIGHALESYYSGKRNPLRHGEAIALGMYCSLWLSTKYCELDVNLLNFYEKWFKLNFDELEISKMKIDDVIFYISQDKKNIGGRPRFILISEPGKPIIDVEVSDEDIIMSLLSLKEHFEID